MANHNLPTQSSTYVNFVNELDQRFDDLCLGLDPARVAAITGGAPTTITNLPVHSVGWSSAGNKWQRWTGSAWTDLAATYAISISGNSATATQLQTACTINGVSFNGTANINVPTQNSITFTNTGGAVAGTTFNGSSARTISYETVGAPSTTGVGASGTWAINITGNAGTASAFQTARTINGTNFDGSANITTANWGTSRTLWGNSVNGSSNITGPLLPSSGTITAPSFSTSGDTNTGIYFPNADTLGITTGGTNAATFDVNGNFVAAGNVTAYSDIRIKKDLIKIDNALNKVLALNGYTYKRLDTEQVQTGLVAQEVEKVLPEAVIKNEDGILSLAYGNLMGLIVESIKDLKSDIDNLRSYINDKGIN